MSKLDPTSEVAAEKMAQPPHLSRQHRAWVALYALQTNERPRAEVLQLNQVTEADLAEFETSWRELRRRSSAPPTTQYQVAEPSAE